MPPELACAALAPAPLSVRELTDLLTALFHDTSSSPGIGVEAFTQTALGLYQFCAKEDVDAALLSIPRGTSAAALA